MKANRHAFKDDAQGNIDPVHAIMGVFLVILLGATIDTTLDNKERNCATTWGTDTARVDKCEADVAMQRNIWLAGCLLLILAAIGVYRAKRKAS